MEAQQTHDINNKLEMILAALLLTKEVLDVEEAARFTKLTESYLYKLTSRQEIPHYKPRGKKVYFKRTELESWLLQHKVKSSTEIQTEAGNHVAKGGR